MAEQWVKVVRSNNSFSLEELSMVVLDPSLQSAVSSRQQEFLRGRWCAQRALAQLGLTVEQIPRLASRAPQWPSGVVGAISHSAQYSCAIVGWSKAFASLGIDIETVGRIKPAIIKSILLPAEVQCFELEWQQTLVFSAKESLYKLLHPIVNTFFGFHDAQITAIEKKQFQIVLHKDLDPFYRGQSFTGVFEYFDNQLLTWFKLPACF